MKRIGKFTFGSVGYGLVFGLFASAMTLPSLSSAQAPSLFVATENLPNDVFLLQEGRTNSLFLVVKPNTQPSGNVTITAGTPSNPDLELSSPNGDSPPTVMYTTTSWDSYPWPVFTVKAAEDADTLDEDVTIVFSASGGGYAGVTGTAKIRILDNDKIIYSPTSFTMDEGGTATVSVKLAEQPSEDATVYLWYRRLIPIGGHAGRLSFDRERLTFTSANWNVNQQITVTAAEEDGDYGDDSNHRLYLSLVGKNRSPYGTVSITMRDNDRNLVLSKKRLDLLEGETDSFDVKLTTLPSANVSVTLTQPSNPDVRVNKTELTFTPSNWDKNQTVNVSVATDSDGLNENASISLSASGGGYNSASHRGSVNVNIMDRTNLLVFPPAQADLTRITEGTSNTTVPALSLARQPTGDVTVTIAQPSNPDLTVDKTSLTFTTRNWKTLQFVGMNAAQDDDSADESTDIVFRASGGGFDGVSRTETITIVDDDLIVLSPTTLTMNEGGTGTINIKLKNQPSENTTVTLESSYGTIAPSGDNPGRISFGPKTFTFTSANWNVNQQITVTATEDDSNYIDNRYRILFLPNGPDEEPFIRYVIEVKDNDRNLVLSTKRMNLFEGDTDNSFDVKLTSQPSANVSVTLTSNNTDVTLNKTMLTFTPSNWHMDQTVNVSVATDSDSLNENATISIAASDGGYDGLSDSVYVDVTDHANLLVFPPAQADLTKITEGTSNTTVPALSLARKPTGNVTVTITQPSNTDLTVDKTLLTIKPGDWKTLQFVGMNAAQDDDSADESADIVFRASGGGFDGTSRTVRITIVDDDLIVLSPTTLTMNEGGTGTINIKLKNQPSENTTVTLESSYGTIAPSGDNPGRISFGPKTFAFTSANWNVNQQITVTATEDNSNYIDNRYRILFLPNGSGELPFIRYVIEVKDNDRILNISQKSFNITEGDTSKFFNVKLPSQPSADVSVTLSSNNTDVTVDKTMLTFTRDDWSENQSQRVNLSVAEDNDALSESADITISSSGGGFDGLSENVRVYVTDNDSEGLTLSSTELDINEGANTTFTVKLASSPSANVTVTLTQPTNTDVTVDTDTATSGNQNTLTFMTSNWQNPQTVRVSAGQDDDTEDDTATIALNASGGGYDNLRGNVAVDVMDDDEGTLDLPSEAVAVTEGSSETFEVKLSAQPSANVTVTLTQPSNADVTVDTDTATSGNQDTLTFTASDWENPQTVSVSAAQDDDHLDEDTSISLSSSGGGYDGARGMVSVDVTDDDEPTFAIPETVNVDEGGSATFKVKLGAVPTGDVSVMLAQPSNTDVTVDTDTEEADNQNTLAFTTDNWNEEQTVTVSAARDDDAWNDSATISFSATGGGFDDSTGDVSVEVADDDEEALTLPSAAVNVTEGAAGSRTFSVKLATRPSDDVLVTLTQPSNTDVKVDTDTSTNGHQNTLTLNAGNWSTGLPVTVSAAEDDDAADDTGVSISVTASGGGYDDETGTVMVKVTDNDEEALALSSDDLTIAEGGSGGFMVKLDTLPSGTVTVSLAQPSNTDVRVDKTSLTFTADDWNVEQAVGVSAGQDHDAWDDTGVSISISASGGGYDDVSDTVAVEVRDDDEEGLTLLPATTVSLEEGGAGTFSVKLATLPSATVTLTFTQPLDDDVRVDTDTSMTGNQNTLTFTSTTDAQGGWNMPKTVIVNAAQDADATDERTSVSMSAAGGGYDNVSEKTLNIAVSDDEEAQLVFSSDDLNVDEGGFVDFTVKLAASPSADVRVTLTQPSNDDVTLDKTSLTFKSTTWNNAQTVRVNAAEDHDTADESTSISLSATGGDYAGAAGLVRVDVSDDDEEALRLPSDRLSVDEGENVAFMVRLETQPSADVRVTLTPPSNTDVTIDKTLLTFTNTTWEEEQTVTVSAGEDPDASDERASISISAAGGGGGYDNLGGSVGVDVADNDEEALVFNSESLSITEGESGEFKVKLATLPSETVRVTFTQPSNGDVTLDTDSTTDGNQNTLDFTIGNWNTDQTVRVSAAEDDDLTEDSATIAVSASRGGYDSVSKSMSVTVPDNDSAGLTVSPTDLDIDEGEHGNFTVRLTQQPSATVRVTLTQPSNADVRVDKTTLTFGQTNWNQLQTVRVNVAQDGDASDESTSVSLSASGGGYNVSESVRVDVTDDDEDALVLPPDDLQIGEGKSGAFTVRLATQPSATVTVRLTQPSNADVMVDTDPDTAGNQNTLSFTNTTWRDARTVAVAVSEDDDAANESASIAVSASGGGYDNLNGTVNVKVSDDDSQALVAPESLSITEGAGGSFDVKLATLPSASVRVFLTQPSNNPDVTIDKDSLIFTRDNWNVGQAVAVSASEDEDTAQDITTLSLRASNLDSSSDSGYDGISDTVRIEVTDNDSPGLTVSPGDLEIVEGVSAVFSVQLARPPSDDVTVTLTPPSNTDVRIDKTSLIFTTSNWNTGQAVRVSAAQDDDTDNDDARIFYTASGADYGGVAGSVTVEVIDDDDSLITLPGNIQGAIVATPENLRLEEGSSSPIAVKLYGVVPTSNVTVVLTTSDRDITLSPGSLTFTPSDWDEDQTVAVTAANDADSVDDTGTITLAATGIDIPSKQVAFSVIDDDDPPPPPPVGARGSITVAPAALVLSEGSSRTFTVGLRGSEPDDDVVVGLSKTNDDVTISPLSLTFTPSNWDEEQSVTLTLAVDDDKQDDTDTITLAATGGGYDGAMQSLRVAGIDNPGRIEVSPGSVELTEGGSSVSFTVGLGVEPLDTQVVIVSLTSSNPGIEFTPSSLVFMANAWKQGQSVSARAAADSNRQGGLDIITLAANGGNYSSVRRTVSVVYIEDGSGQEPASLSDPIKAQALAIPPAVAGDQSTLFIACKQDRPCTVILDCAAQSDGSAFQGTLPEAIPARGVRRLTTADIETYTGGSWSGKGRLGCALRSKDEVASQVWTRSGDGVLVNNSGYIRSYPEGDGYRADIESITSPDGFEKSNIRIRCTASGGENCTSTRFECYEDDGVRHDSASFDIAASSVRHLQSEELASMIGHRWRGMELACELRSDASFTVQILTRTGGGGALVNNSGGGGARIGLSGG